MFLMFLSSFWHGEVRTGIHPFSHALVWYEGFYELVDTKLRISFTSSSTS